MQFMRHILGQTNAGSTSKVNTKLTRHYDANILSLIQQKHFRAITHTFCPETSLNGVVQSYDWDSVRNLQYDSDEANISCGPTYLSMN